MSAKKVGRIGSVEADAIKRLYGDGAGQLTVEQIAKETGRSEQAIRVVLGLEERSSVRKGTGAAHSLHVTLDGGRKAMVHLPMGSAPGGKFTDDEVTTLVDLIANMGYNEDEEPQGGGLFPMNYKSTEQEVDEARSQWDVDDVVIH